VRKFARHLDDFAYQASTVDVVTAGTQTTIQDHPGRVGYWAIGVPPSGPPTPAPTPTPR
jgi:urea carboxylase